MFTEDPWWDEGLRDDDEDDDLPEAVGWAPSRSREHALALFKVKTNPFEAIVATHPIWAKAPRDYSAYKEVLFGTLLCYHGPRTRQIGTTKIKSWYDLYRHFSRNRSLKHVTSEIEQSLCESPIEYLNKIMEQTTVLSLRHEVAQEDIVLLIIEAVRNCYNKGFASRKSSETLPVFSRDLFQIIDHWVWNMARCLVDCDDDLNSKLNLSPLALRYASFNVPTKVRFPEFHSFGSSMFDELFPVITEKDDLEEAANKRLPRYCRYTGYLYAKLKDLKSTCSDMKKALRNTPGDMVFICSEKMGYNKAGREAREMAITSKRLAAVVALPNHVVNHISEPLMVFHFRSKDACQDQENVAFINLSDKDYWTRKSGRGALNTAKAFWYIDDAMLHLSSPDMYSKPSYVKYVAFKDLESENYELVVAKHFLSSSTKQDLDQIQKLETPLESVAEFMSPLATERGDDEEKILTAIKEVCAKDITQIGTITTPMKETRVNMERPKVKKMILRTGDIVFSLKGAPGTCALVNETTALLKLVPSHNMCIVRLRPEVKGVTPVSLLRYFKSNLFKSYLSQKRNGHDVNRITPNDLKQCPIPILTEDELKAEEAAFNQQRQYLEEIEDRKVKIKTLQAFPSTKK